jgi:AcrR family transcriptional regulator
VTSKNTVGAAAGPASQETGGDRDEGGRPLRADARRNYERLLATARDVFNEQGAGAPMETIAKRAEVGVGTLYRHFPKRIDLVEAVYRNDVDELVITAEKAAANLEPWPAVESFLRAFVRYAQTKRTLMNELHEAFEKNPDLRSQCRERIDGAMELIIGRGQRAGVVRTDVRGPDVTALVSPMCTSASMTPEQADRLLPMILDGLHTT